MDRDVLSLDVNEPRARTLAVTASRLDEIEKALGSLLEVNVVLPQRVIGIDDERGIAVGHDAIMSRSAA